MVFQCHRCFYITKNKKDMKKHLNRKNKCLRQIDSYKYNENKLEELSLINNNEDEIKIKQKNHNEKICHSINKNISDNIINLEDPNNITNSIHKNNLSDNIEKYIQFIKKNNIVDCLYCQKKFYRKYELIRHIQKNCSKYNNIDNNKAFLIESDPNNNNNNTERIIDNENMNENKNENKNDNDSSYINYINNTINNQQINNISINVFNNEIEKNKLYMIPFDKEWDISNIDHQKKLLLFLSDNKYSNTMEEILKNDKNKNILFDDNNDSGLIFQDDKFMNMDSDEIIIKMMYKLYNHLQTFYDEIKNNNYINCDLDKHKYTLEEKYIEFNKNKDSVTKELVKNILVDIFHNNKDKIITQFIEFNKFLSEEKNKVGY